MHANRISIPNIGMFVSGNHFREITGTGENNIRNNPSRTSVHLFLGPWITSSFFFLVVFHLTNNRVLQSIVSGSQEIHYISLFCAPFVIVSQGAVTL